MQKVTTTKRQFEIIQAAGKILISSGINGLTTKNLAIEMGFTESALYRHFKCKHDIIAAMLNYLADNMQQRFDKIITKSQTPKDNLTALFNSQFDFFSDNPYFVIAVLSDGLMQESETINQCIKSLMAIKSKHLIAIINQGQTQGIFTQNITVKQTVHLIMGSFRLLILKWRMDDFTFNIKLYGNQTIQTLLTLLEKL